MSNEIIPLSEELLALLGSGEINALGLPKHEIFLLDIVVAGTTFCPVVPALRAELLPETMLRMVRCPDNEHDRYAIAIYYKENRIGYVPRELNLVISRLMDAGLFQRGGKIRRLREVTNVTHRCLHVEVVAKKPPNGSGFRRGLDNHEFLVCFSH